MVDTVSGATPLAALKQNGFTDSSVSVLHMFIGDIQGTIGETSALAILIGAAILLVFKVIDLKIPLTYIGSFAVFVILYMLGTGKGFDVNYLFSHIFGGGLGKKYKYSQDLHYCLMLLSGVHPDRLPDLSYQLRSPV